MDVNFGFLCDYADNTTGKLTAIGIGFDTMYAPSEPATHRQFFAVLSVNFTSVERGQKDISLHIIDADGKDVIPPRDFTVAVQAPTPGWSFRTQRIVMGLGNVTFPTFGDYSVIYLIGGQEIHRMPLKVSPPPEQPSTV